MKLDRDLPNWFEVGYKMKIIKHENNAFTIITQVIVKAEVNYPPSILFCWRLK